MADTHRDAILELATALRQTPIDDTSIDLLVRFAELVKAWNAKLNLTGAKTIGALAEVLFADALVLADPAIVPDGARFVDVGAGAGAPSLPLAVMRRDVRALLVEPIQKRIAFMRTAVGTLDLVGRVELRAQRLEGALEGAPFDVALARATFEPLEWLDRARVLSDDVIVFTAGELPEHVASTRIAERRYTLPFSRAPRAIGLYRRRLTD